METEEYTKFSCEKLEFHYDGYRFIASLIFIKWKKSIGKELKMNVEEYILYICICYIKYLNLYL